MFPNAGAQVYYNEAGEPTGWDNGGYDDGPDPDDFYDDVEDDDEDEDEPEPQEPDDAETSWQEYGREEAYAEAEMARYDDDPSPYEGTYSEM
jgi:hypothetical protein